MSNFDVIVEIGFFGIGKSVFRNLEYMTTSAFEDHLMLQLHFQFARDFKQKSSLVLILDFLIFCFLVASY